ncbi:50S ribosomal protein L16 3-hydroxylase [Salinibacter ruber]|uniref:ribosomal protein uL16 3-hydroxylase n=1 Tax=Salinibacter ruber TaxID=146919 RepID=UPI0021698F75|nr:cupin domain-containing protein [Salinibacter ruber]MCS3628638.1 50S ribosomal protein L16 3-hydroxylase [Salinibacter ruber]MCS3826780.1 50S ribosomal protein L16 3-hydroxylase [Salinibacter ruber]MCS4145547.1 50S ribosomal protein L16 3-hydroxylase [Salinibacter ruber]
MQPATPTSSVLGDRSPADFLDTYWQERPLVVRDALPDFRSPLSPEELAGLACEDGVESRLILEEGGEHPWELRHGPFASEEFLHLPETHWTLLVQEVDRLIPEVGALLDRFRFLPDWRLDDVMVSYAPTHGTVGPHIDNYDVFLLQGAGHRRWQIGTETVDDEEIVPDLDVRILADFEAEEEFVLGPGDLLYLPPRVAHYGVATDDQCMTYSVGFRAPRHQDLVGNFLQQAMDTVGPDARYSDPDLSPVDHPGEIHDDARQTVRRLLRDLVRDDDAIDQWFGQYLTRPGRDREAVPPETPVTDDELTDMLRAGHGLRPGPVSRLAFIEHDDGSVTLFANGSPIDLSPDRAYAARLVTGRQQIPSDALTPHLEDDAFVDLLVALVNDGLLEWDAA